MLNYLKIIMIHNEIIIEKIMRVILSSYNFLFFIIKFQSLLDSSRDN